MQTNTTYVPPAEQNPLLNHDFDDELFVPTGNEPGLEKQEGEEVVLKDITSYIEKDTKASSANSDGTKRRLPKKTSPKDLVAKRATTLS